MDKKYELLAPVGSPEALRAAVQAGADAIYMGGKSFSARQYATNFDKEDLKEAIDYAHLRGVKVYITMNTLIKNREMEEALEEVEYLYNIGVDALIVQDLGLAYGIRRFFPNFELHGSTQMTIHNAQGAKVLEDLGFSRVVVSREMTLEQIKEIKKQSNIELEVFVHGALCVSYSGQCLMSSMIGGRSGNRGRCAQPCRKQYNLDVGSKLHRDKYLLSPKDLCTVDDIKALLDANIVSFKIEGRMKRPEYVAMAVSTYRKAIDSYLREGKSSISNREKNNLAQVFNRGFTRGYLFNEGNKNLMSIDKPNNRGILLGKVVSYDARGGLVDILLSESLAKGDGIEIWKGEGDNIGTRVDKLLVKGQPVQQAQANTLVSVPIKGDVAKNDIVYKTNDDQLNKSLTPFFSGENIRKRSLCGYVKIKISHPPTIKLCMGDICVEVEGDGPVEQAQRKALDIQTVTTQLSKLGDTPFSLDNLEVELEEGAFMPMASLNDLRRRAIDKLSNIILEAYRPGAESKSLGVKEQYKNWLREGLGEAYTKEHFRLAVGTDRLEVVKLALDQGIKRIYYQGLKDMDGAIELVNKAEGELFMALPRISTTHETNQLYQLYQRCKGDIKGVILSNLGQVERFKGEDIYKVGDFSLNSFNNAALMLLKELKLHWAILSPELRLSEIREISSDKAIPIELMVYGKLPVMITEYCPLSIDKRDAECKDCKGKCIKHQVYLTDKTGARFLVTKDCLQRTVIYNSQPLYLCDNIKEVVAVNPEFLRLDITDETIQEVELIIEGYREALSCIYNNSCDQQHINNLDNWMKERGFTRGHYFRGVE